MADEVDSKNAELRSVRDTVESIWVAIVLAFVLRAFLIEAFVIPTGSMAPRLMGEHWELQCSSCGYPYAFGAPRAMRMDSSAGARPESNIPVSAMCPNCGFSHQTVRSQPASGDRVLVLKYLYHLAGPSPWDVVVFRNPQNNHENYIKRLVGLPGQTLEIVHGNIFITDDPNAADANASDEKVARFAWRVLTKPPRAQEAMWQVIYDNDYQPDRQELHRQGLPIRGWFSRAGSAAWDANGDFGRTFAFRGGKESALTFGVEGAANPERALREVFLPHYGYNQPSEESRSIVSGTDVCSDLKLSCVFKPGASDSTVSLALSSFNHYFKGEVRADGTVTMYMLDSQSPPEVGASWTVLGSPVKIAPLETDREHEIALTHADLTVTVWVNGRAVMTLPPGEYPENYGSLKRHMVEALRDHLSRPTPVPMVRISAQGAPCALRHVKLMRDVYYTEQMLAGSEDDPRYTYIRKNTVGRAFGYDPDHLSGHAGWGTRGHRITLRKNPKNPDLDEFFVLGDNSPLSQDGRMWTAAAPTLQLYDAENRPQYKPGTVPRYNMLGRAMFVYWPAGFSPPMLSLPVLPNVGKMRLIR